jgi:hypothetical protein
VPVAVDRLCQVAVDRLCQLSGTRKVSQQYGPMKWQGKVVKKIVMESPFRGKGDGHHFKTK